ncbi:MAG TPA: hypothetical protein P5048_02745 [Chlamydiales bacterium]|nr:hypothetical protein [Chlamydiales bacterium]
MDIDFSKEILTPIEVIFSFSKIPAYLFPKRMMEEDYQSIKNIQSIVHNFRKCVRQWYEFMSRTIPGWRFITTAICDYFIPILYMIDGLFSYAGFLPDYEETPILLVTCAVVGSIFIETISRVVIHLLMMKQIKMFNDFAIQYKEKYLIKSEHEQGDYLDRVTIPLSLHSDSYFLSHLCDLTGMPLRNPVKFNRYNLIIEKTVAEKLLIEISKREKKTYVFSDLFTPMDSMKARIDRKLEFYQRESNRQIEMIHSQV